MDHELQQAESAVRLDRWLWAVRLFKTRSQATTACRLGQVAVGGCKVKPSRALRVGDELEVEKPLLVRRVRVLALLEQRVGAKRVPEFLEELTTDDAWAAAREEAAQRRANRVFEPGAGGRPTKRQRRLIQDFLGSVERSAEGDGE